MFLFFLFINFCDVRQISVNAKQIIPYPWLVFNEKVKINDILIRDSTGVSDSMLILFGGALSNGKQVIS
jgi:ATP-dependent RNA helicase DHX36